MRPEFTGALAGMLNTSRQLGSSIGSAVAGGVLATLLASDMRAKAIPAASGLPAPARSPFLGGFASLSQTGLSVGRGQSGGATADDTDIRSRDDRHILSWPLHSFNPLRHAGNIPSCSGGVSTFRNWKAWTGLL